MRPAWLVAILVLTVQPSLAELRRPSCEVLFAHGYSMKATTIERSFGMRLDDMSLDDFNAMLDVVQGCIDLVNAQPPDIPGLLPRELKSSQLNVFSILAEEIRFHRSRARERERDRRAVK